jgi:hypothetical protein
MGVAARRPVIEPRDAQQPEADIVDAADVKVPADDAAMRPDRHRAAVQRAAAVVRAERQTPPQASSETAGRPQPTRRSSQAEQAGDTSPSESDRQRGLVNPISRVQVLDVQTPAPAQDKPGPREDTGVLREPVTVSPVVSARIASAPGSPPRIEVNIGRVEVRAVYAQPPSPARKQPALPATSLDNYLKQRDRTG